MHRRPEGSAPRGRSRSGTSAGNTGQNGSRRGGPHEDQEAASPPRIIGGTLRGRPLEFSPSDRTRPMKDRVRETLFNLLGPDVTGALAVDLFAGSGALAFEAISRGAARAILVERHFPTADLLRRSARALGVTDRVDVRPGDALLWAKRMPPLPTDRPWIVFVSPPWSFFADRLADLGPLVEAFVEAAPPRSIVVVESDSTFDPARLPRPGQWRSRMLEPAVLHLWNGGDAV